jgi:hypothetical protein
MSTNTIHTLFNFIGGEKCNELINFIDIDQLNECYNSVLQLSKEILKNSSQYLKNKNKNDNELPEKQRNMIYNLFNKQIIDFYNKISINLNDSTKSNENILTSIIIMILITSKQSDFEIKLQDAIQKDNIELTEQEEYDNDIDERLDRMDKIINNCNGILDNMECSKN